MFRSSIVSFLSLAALAANADTGKYSIKTAAAPVPKEVKAPIARLLADQSVQLLDDKGKLLAEFWFRKELPAKATPEQIKAGLSYRELEETTLLGAVRFHKEMGDYRKQGIKPGVYTLRLGFQPMNGDHMGTAPYPEFGLLVPADSDETPEPLKTPKELHELSTKASGTAHPAVFLLYPNMAPEDKPKLAPQPNDQWLLSVKEPVNVGGQKAALGIGLTVIGHTAE